MTPSQDCLVIGAGPAGLAAAIYLGRFRRSVLVVEHGRSRASWIPRSHNHPGFPAGVRGRTLLARMRRQAERYGAQFLSARAEGLERRGEGFVLETSAGSFHAPFVILATGVVDRLPDLPGLEDAVARGLLRICPICDGYEAIGQRIGVLGDGEHCAREALFLRTWSDSVTFIRVGATPLSAALAAELRAGGVEIIQSGLRGVRIEAHRITAFDFDDGQPRAFDTVYSALGAQPRNELALQAGAQVAADGRLVVGDHQETSTPGLYAAGDVVRGLNQISTAEGEGAIAATDVHNRLRDRARA